MDSIIKKPGVHTLILLWAIACFAFFQFCYPYHFFYQEQNQLFLFSSDYLLTYLDKPGWLATLTGDFLTQFYYYRIGGPTILTLMLLLLGYNVRCAMEVADVKGTAVPYTVAICMMTLVALLCLDCDYQLSSVVALAGGTNVFRASTKLLTNTRMFIKKIESMQETQNVVNGMGLPHWVSAISIFITVPVCHWFFGCGIWMYAALVIVGCLMNIMKPGNYLRLAALVIPFFLLLLGKRLYFVDFYTLYTYPGIGKFTQPQMDMEKSFATDCEYYLGNYNDIINIIGKEKEPNKYMKFYYNLVSAQNHSLSSNLLKFPNNYLGTSETLDKKTPPLTINILSELYWVLGDMTTCERATILGNIHSPGSRSIRMVKRMAEINLVTQNYDAARKYLRILSKTTVWRSWSKRIIAAMGHHATEEDQATLQPYIDKRKYMNTQDTIRLDNTCHTILTELAKSNPDNNMAINYMLCSDLLQKDLNAFKHDYDAYYLKQKSVKYDRLYQEALMIYLTQTNATPAEWSYYIKRQDVLQQYHLYSKQRGSTDFSQTYWYYYDKAKRPQNNH